MYLLNELLLLIISLDINYIALHLHELTDSSENIKMCRAYF